MTRLGKNLLLLEVGVCFLPAAFQLALGYIVAPFQVFFLITAGPQAKFGSLMFLLIIATASCGFVALHSVMTWLLYQTRTNLRPRTVTCLMCIGILPLVGMAFVANNVFGQITVIPPLLCSVHLAWLARGYLSGSDTLPRVTR
jgi:hypothetical protein